MGAWNKFLLLMWKNWMLQFRKPISFIIEIVIPLLVVSLFLLMKTFSSSEIVTQKLYDPVPITHGEDIFEAVNGYYPNDNKLINEVMSQFPNAKPFASTKELEEYLTSPDMKNGAVGVQFDRQLPQEIQNALNVSITLRFDSRQRWYTDELFPVAEMGYGSRDGTSESGGPPAYYDVFAPLMYILTNRFLQQHDANEELPPVFLQRFPYPSYTSDSFLKIFTEASLFGFLFMTAFVYAFCNLIKSITYEKEKQLKESMKVMGLPTWLHWTAWYCKMIIPFGLIAFLIVVLMKWETKGGRILEHSDCCLIFVFMFLYVSAIITFAFACSTLFSKANRAASVSSIIWIISYVPYIIYGSQQHGPGIKYIASLGLTSAMSYGFDIIVLYEGVSQGVRWDNLFTKNEQINVTFGGILIMLLVDIFVYLMAALYIEAIFPGEFGVPREWYFFLTRDFWCTEKIEQDEYLLNTNNEEFFEEEPTDLKAGIMIRNLGKTFGANEAVKGITLNMYEDQITVLLGHNGAGKTTTMSMLSGMFPPTKGTAVINGYDIRSQIMKVRDSMGICPQHNVLFDELTVREHLIFFSRLKGCSGAAEVEAEVERYLKLLSLEDKADQKSTALSGGMKRKLCVGIALCGKSKIIMLDEPTAGMDPSARRYIWEFLQKQKKGRTILLTTHFMDEADLLGDRIAIMSGGELSCCGTSFFLKKKYGTGYHLIIDQSPTCNPKNISNVIRKYIPNIEVESNAGTELTYLLPETYASKFTHMLAELENNSEELGIRSFGISLTDLEEVFMKVGTNETGKALPKTREMINNDNGTVVNIGLSNMKNGPDLWLNQILSMAMKKFITAKRSWGVELLKIVLPLLYIILVMYTASSATDDTFYKTRSFDLDQYNRPTTLVQKNNNNREQHYVNMLHNMKQTVEETDNMTDRILSLTKQMPFKVRYKYVVGASFEDVGAFAWFNNEPFHSVPLAVQLLLNQKYKSVLGDQYQINFVNYPLPKNITDDQKDAIKVGMSNVNVMSLSLAVAFIGTFYILFDIKEKNSQARHLQFVSGINPLIFRFVAFFCDLCTFVIPCVAILITFAIFKTNGLSSPTELGILALLLFSFGVVLMPWMYVFSFLFTIPSTGYSRMFFLSFFTGYPCVMIALILNLLQWKHATCVTWILRLFPHFDFSEGVYDLIGRYTCNIYWESCLKSMNQTECSVVLCKFGCCGPNTLQFAEHGIVYNLLMMYAIAIVTFVLLFLIDKKMISNLIYVAFKRLDRPPRSPDHVDADVMDENMYVRTHNLDQMREQFVLVLKDLTKHYRSLTAVNGLNLTVKKSECFGLLGVNGAGKTTTFKMMTGDEMISHGDGWINGYSIKNEMDKVQRFIGYCPQFDALLDNLTARETLVMFSLIRGVPRDECNYLAEKLAREFDFFQHLDKEVRKLSGGNKRKLSTSIALIGDAPIIFLDEPSTGMDPATKRHLWNNLAKIRESGKSIILTSHSMEECEALCTRIAVMVNGNFQCLGSTQHLKSKFAEGYSITLKIKKPEQSSGLEHSDTEEVERFMRQNFPNAELREKHQELLTYFVKDKNLTWSKLFGVLEQTKGRLDIEDYSVGQASLEQVFLTFTKNQVGNEEVKFKKGCWRLCC